VTALRHLWNRLTSRVREQSARGERLPYHTWLASRIATRKATHPAGAAPYRYSVISLVYERSDARYLEEAHASLMSQSLPFFEWVIFAQGPLTAELAAVLDRLAGVRRTNILRSDTNLGIIRGMRMCLEAARGDYIVPLDADDLLTEDALQLVDHAAHGAARPAFIYSDEDALIAGVPRHPYLRPDWDPVLNWTSSYIWHLCAFDRRIALELGVFSDAGSEYCQDWDTVVRFANAGHQPHHVREVLYHWRQHEASSTNRATSNDAGSGSLRSTRHLLERQIARLAQPEHYAVEEFPLFRGATEWHVGRRHTAAAAMELIVLARTAASGASALRAVLESSDYPIASAMIAQYGPDKSAAGNYEDEAAAGAHATRVQFIDVEGASALREAVRRTTSAYVTVCSDAVTAMRPDALWEALKLFELCRDTALVCARTTDAGGVVVQGAAVFGKNGLPLLLDRGKRANDAGPYALLLKAHTAGFVHIDFFVASGEFLRRAVLPAAASLAASGMWLGARAAQEQARVAYSPLVAVQVSPGVLGLTDTQQLAQAEKDAFSATFGSRLGTSHLSVQRYMASASLYA
jgi:Glycosyl transferase family 2